MMNRDRPVWLITGGSPGRSTGFGRELARLVLARLRRDFDAWEATTVGADFPASSG